jgi:small subunit ribosomal protein S5
MAVNATRNKQTEVRQVPPTEEQDQGKRSPAPTSAPAPASAPALATAPAGPSSGEERAVDENVVKIYRCATVVRGGRRFSFSALVVVGDRRGHVGVGYGKAVEVPSAVDKGRKIATRNLSPVRIVNGTLPHRVRGRYGASVVVMVPAGPGTGVIAGASVRAVLELAGYTDVLTKSYGSNSPKNLVRATFEGLRHLLGRDEVERLRGVRVAS